MMVGVPSHDRPPTMLGRRTLLLGAGALGVSALAACTSTDAPRTTVTVRSTASGAADPMAGLVATTRLHVLRLNSAIAATKADASLAASTKSLTVVLQDRKAQFAALVKEWQRTDPASAGSAASVDLSQTSPLPPEAKGPVAAAREDLTAARSALTDALGVVSRYRATIIASVLAGVACDQVVLG